MTFYRLLCLLFMSCLSLPVFAYIDPGSGSAIMSAVIGFIVACWLVIKTYWYKLKGFFLPGTDPEKEKATEETPEESER